MFLREPQPGHAMGADARGEAADSDDAMFTVGESGAGAVAIRNSNITPMIVNPIGMIAKNHGTMETGNPADWENHPLIPSMAAAIPALASVQINKKITRIVLPKPEVSDGCMDGPPETGRDDHALACTILICFRGSVRPMMSLTPCWLKPLKPSLRSRFSRCDPIAPT